MLQVLRKKPKSETPQPVETLPQVILPPAIKRYRAGPRITAAGVTDHSLLSNLLVDKHTQYALADKSRPTTWVSATDLSPRSLADLGIKDHHLLDGLLDDDHTQYALADKSRPNPWVSASDLTELMPVMFGFFHAKVSFPYVSFYPLNGHANEAGTTEDLANCPMIPGRFVKLKFNVTEMTESIAILVMLRINGIDTNCWTEVYYPGIYTIEADEVVAEDDVACLKVTPSGGAGDYAKFIPTLLFKMF